MGEYKSAAESAREIRTALKARGWGQAMVAVRSHSYSMGSSVRVEIKSAKVPFRVVELIAKGQERVDRDDATGEILCGGNRFVFVEYGEEVMEEAARPIQAQLEAAAVGEQLVFPGDRNGIQAWDLTPAGWLEVCGRLRWAEPNHQRAARMIALTVLRSSGDVSRG